MNNVLYCCMSESVSLSVSLSSESVVAHEHATVIINSINYMYKLCLSTVKDDRHEKEERKTKH